MKVDLLRCGITLCNMGKDVDSVPHASGKRLEFARIAAGFENEILFAQSLSGKRVPQSTYTQHESGNRGLKLGVARRYAEGLGNCDAAWLMTGHGRAPPGWNDGPSPQNEQGVALPLTHNPDDTPLPDRNFREADIPRDNSWIAKPRVPLMGTGEGGSDGSFVLNTGTPIDHMARPPKADGAKVYCIYLEGDSMHPRFDSGDLLFVDPVKKPVAGRDVVIQMRPKNEGDDIRAFVKQIVAINSEVVEVKQFHPEKTWPIKRREILHIHVILRTNEMY